MTAVPLEGRAACHSFPVRPRTRTRRAAAESVLGVIAAIALHHIGSDVVGIAKGCCPAFAIVGAALAAARAIACTVVGTRAVAIVGGDGLVDEKLLNLSVGKALLRLALLGERLRRGDGRGSGHRLRQGHCDEQSNRSREHAHSVSVPPEWSRPLAWSAEA